MGSARWGGLGDAVRWTWQKIREGQHTFAAEGQEVSADQNRCRFHSGRLMFG